MQVNLTPPGRPTASAPPIPPGTPALLGVRESRGSYRGSPLRDAEERRAKERNLLQMAPEAELACSCVLLRARRFSPKNLELAEDITFKKR